MSKSGKAARQPMPPTSAGEALEWLGRHGDRRTIDGMARYGIPSDRAFGVTVGATKSYAKAIGRNHVLAQELWASGWYEARLLASFVDDPRQVTTRQMDQWAADFDNWAVCDTVCFHLFDRTPHAWKKARQWVKARPEFVKRAGLALFWSLTVHDKAAPNEEFLAVLPLIEAAADDGRDLVRKGASMALRAIGKRNAALHAGAVEVAQRLADSRRDAARWVGKVALKELASAAVRARVARSR